MTQDTLFETIDEDLVPQPDPEKDWEAELVGEGKKFKDSKALAYSAVVKDSFIERLQKENAKLRGELSQKKTLEDVLTAIESKSKQPEPGTPSGEKGPDVSPQELEKLIEEKATKAALSLTKEEKARANVESVMTILEEAWGPDFRARLEVEARKYSLGKDFVTTLAREKPQALLALLGLKKDPQPEATPKAPTGTVNPSALPRKGTTEKTYSYYAKMKKENPKLYNTPAIQNEMHQQALKLREAFFDA